MSQRRNAAMQRERTDFKELSKYGKTLCGALTAIFAVLPIGGFFIEALLPDMLGLIAPTIAVFMSVAIMFFLYYSYRNSEYSRIGKVAKIFFGIATTCLIIFIFAWFGWVKQVDGRWHITGLTLTAEAQDAITKRYVTNDTPKALLDRLGHRSEDRIWEKRWVVQAVMTLTFVAFFACVTGSFFLFVLQNLVPTAAQTPNSP